MPSWGPMCSYGLAGWLGVENPCPDDVLSRKKHETWGDSGLVDVNSRGRKACDVALKPGSSQCHHRWETA